jgi:uncharacterized protein YbcI
VATRGRVRSDKFFRIKLLSITDIRELQGLVSSLRKETDELIEHVHSIMWNMRGSLSREEAWSLSHKERKSLLKQIDERVKLVEKTGLALL